MAQLLVIREQIKYFYVRYENFCKPTLKFILELVALICINRHIGYASALGNTAIVLVLALLCSFLPVTLMILLDSLIILLHLYALSLEVVVVMGIIFLLMFLLYFRFSPQDSILLILTPICCLCRIPYVIPLAAGLIATPTAVLSTGCGVVVYYFLKFVSENAASLSTVEEETIIVQFRFLIDAIIKNREMMVMIAAFGVTIIAVYLFRRLSIDHAWTIAIVTGALINILIILLGDLKYSTYISVSGLIVGSFVSVLIVIVLKFFVFNVDYARTEKVQFEDDEYYYYVKAVPKNRVSLAERKVKKIKGRQNAPETGTASSAKKSSREDAQTPSRAESKDANEYRVRRSTTKRIVLPGEDIPDEMILKTHTDAQKGRTADRAQRMTAAGARAERKSAE